MILYIMSMDESRKVKAPKVYVIQQIPGTSEGRPLEINILGASGIWRPLCSCLPEKSQIIFSPGPLIFKLRKALLKDYTT